MRKTLLLLTTMALALLVAGGVALAATITCQVGVVCNGTSEADTITGIASNDTINGLEGNDFIKARGGSDKIDGGPNNDTLNGGPGNDTYMFFGSWGIDRISADSGGVDTLTFPGPRSMGVSVDPKADGANTCENSSPGMDPCFTQQGDFIENVVGTAFEDRIFGNISNNQINSGAGGTGSFPELLDGRYGGDTYKGYAPGGTTYTVDQIQDTPVLTDTHIDKLNLAKFDLAEVSIGYGWYGYPEDPQTPTFLTISLLDGSGGIRLLDYFDGTSTDFCATKPGTGLIEKIIFADDPNVDFTQVKSTYCGGSVQAPGSDAAPGNLQEIRLPQSAAPKPDSSNGTNGVTTNLQR